VSAFPRTLGEPYRDLDINGLLFRGHEDPEMRHGKNFATIAL
jgi:hypothetical protein